MFKTENKEAVKYSEVMADNFQVTEMYDTQNDEQI
jgi:hypothetical protein